MIGPNWKYLYSRHNVMISRFDCTTEESPLGQNLAALSIHVNRFNPGASPAKTEDLKSPIEPSPKGLTEAECGENMSYHSIAFETHLSLHLFPPPALIVPFRKQIYSSF